MVVLLCASATSSCQTLREWWGEDTLGNVGVCPTLIRYPVPKLKDLEVDRIQYDAKGQQELVLAVEDWDAVAWNHAALIATIHAYQREIDIYRRAYPNLVTEP